MISSLRQPLLSESERAAYQEVDQEPQVDSRDTKGIGGGESPISVQGLSTQEKVSNVVGNDLREKLIS